MITLYTIGFTQKSAEQFFELLKNNHISKLVDIRINNASQLAGFAKGKDLQYFVKQKKLPCFINFLLCNMAVNFIEYVLLFRFHCNSCDEFYR